MKIPARLRLVSRRLVRAPLFTSMAVATLALGIGANTAIFSVIRGVLLKPLPFSEPERLVGVWHTAPGIGIPVLNQSPSLYLTYRDANHSFEDTAIWDNGAVAVTGTGEPERVSMLEVSDGLLPILRIQPALGRRFTADDDKPKAPDRVMLSHAFWVRKFGSDPSAIGRLLTIDGKAYEIIGVLPAGFRFSNADPELLLPVRLNPAELFVGQFNYQGIARLKPGVTIAQANADVNRMIPMVMQRFPMPPGFTQQMFNDARISADVHALSQDVIGDVGRVLWIVFGTVGMVLLIACANVANLFLVRAEGRQQELAIHAALGAGARRIAWELLSESLSLAGLGGVVGLAAAYLGVRALVAAAPDGLPRVEDIGIDAIVVLFTLGISLLAG